MPGSIVGYAVLLQHCRVNFAGMLIPTNKPKTEAFRASEGLNASRIQELFFSDTSPINANRLYVFLRDLRGSISFCGLINFAVALLIIFLSSNTALAAAIPPLEGLELARRGFAGVKDFTAEITQEKQIALLKRSMKSSGQVRFKRPDRFYMEVYSPYPSRLLLKDNVMTMVLPADGIKQQNVLPKGEGLFHWFMLLDRPLSRLPEGVEVRAESLGGILTLDITPKEKRGVRDIKITLLEDGRPSKIVIEEQNLDRTVIHFRRVKKNVGLTEDDFRME